MVSVRFVQKPTWVQEATDCINKSEEILPMPLFIIINEHISNTVMPKRGKGKAYCQKCVCICLVTCMLEKYNFCQEGLAICKYIT